MTFADLGAVRLFFQCQGLQNGAGPPLLFIGGTAGDLRRPETQFWPPLARDFDVLAYDQRGMGRSDKPDRPCSMADYADDAARLMDHRGWADAHVIGVSFGGMVAQELVLRHPGRVRRLILCCTSSGGEGGASFAFHDLPPMTAMDRARHMFPISDTRRDAAWQAAHPAETQMLLALSGTDPYADEPGHAAGAARQLAARARHDTWARLPQIRCPVLVMGGRFDGIATPDNVTRLAQRIPGAALQFFDGGHLFMLQDARAYPAMREFLTA